MPNIAYYISSHGYGHAARQQAVIKELSQRGLSIYVRTATPEKFFKSATDIHQQRYDIGMIQHDALHYDIPASLQWMAEFLSAQEALIQQEITFIQQNDIRLIVSDMPPIACEIASRVGIPSVVLTHFTWDWVYEHYTGDYPQYQHVVEQIREQYNKATLALQMQLPIPHAFDMFPNVEPIPLIYNATSQSRAEVRAKFDIPDNVPMILLSMGGHSWGDSNIRALKSLKSAIFLVMPSAWEQVQDIATYFRQVPMGYDDYHNLIAHADVIVGKAGGSTVAEVLGHQTPMIYTLPDKIQWRESGLLSATLREYTSAEYVPMADFMAGAWIDCLPDFLSKKHHWAEIERDGVRQTARTLLECLT